MTAEDPIYLKGEYNGVVGATHASPFGEEEPRAGACYSCVRLSVI